MRTKPYRIIKKVNVSTIETKLLKGPLTTKPTSDFSIRSDFLLLLHIIRDNRKLFEGSTWTGNVSFMITRYLDEEYL